ncbi:MAG: 50S ribosomal protein L22 [bacterium]
MEVKASIKNLRMSPQKVRLVADMIRGQPVKKALHDLKFCAKRAAQPLEKLLKSAIANAKHNHKVKDEQELVVSEIRVDEAATLKRWRFVSRGRIHRIAKRVSHVSLVLSERKQSKIQDPKTKK